MGFFYEKLTVHEMSDAVVIDVKVSPEVVTANYCEQMCW